MTHPLSFARAAATLAALAALTTAAAAQMPDARAMSGIPMPSPEVPAGSVSVRLVRGQLSNNIANHPVELHAGARTETATTDENGRAVFSGLPPGTSGHVMAEVDGERLESQDFQVPAEAGIKLVLVAGAGTAAAAGAGASLLPPLAEGEVVFGSDSRIQIEFDDDAIEVFYLFDIVNPAPAPVTPRNPLVFELPESAQQASALEGSSPQATVRGRTVSVTGPLAPGVTKVHLAFSLAPSGPDQTLVQRLPALWGPIQVIMARAAQARMSSPQFTSTREMPGNSGQPFVLGSGGMLPANQEFVLTLSSLPSRSRWGRNVSLALAALILFAGVYAAMSARSPSGDVSRRGALAERRDRLMAELVRVEEQRRAGALDQARYAARHADLVTQLERVYGELDRQPGAADQG